MAQESEYELKRKQKIKENNEIMRTIFGEALNFPNASENRLSAARTTTPTARAKSCDPCLPYAAGKQRVLTPLRRNPKRSARSYSTDDIMGYSDASDDDDIISENIQNRLFVHWIGPLTKKRRIEDNKSSVNGVISELSHKHVKPRPRIIQHLVRPVSDFTEEDLLLVAETVADKRYDSINGSSCHQCRQKTDDLKTVCRNENCVGIRGQFCGPCLRNRYGESVKEAIMDPDWICPPCRNICNCSFCMKKRGRRCTGQLIGVARQNGYTDVKSFLGD
ncbi:cell division cycle-associated protein 7-like [Dendronephthya gigantea]|uniref:cell division cycle-associated protein 7-like n=1 Tax=Dendronephthya gigantea TaxID=151771 RepID=UPI00106CDE78|nr:cell division cycle-associated protein 7-like [Dendronephthya gigantea]